MSSKSIQVQSAPTDGVHNSVSMFLQNIKSDDRSMYLYIPAVASGEYYGPNTWGDYFPEESLKKYFKTFYNAKVYRGHKNSDPRKSIGDVVLSIYNDDRHRVELVVRIYKNLAKDIAEQVEQNRPVGFSMGCRVPYEKCSYCDSKFYKTADRCDHLKFHMNDYIDGKRVYAINEHPEFFDISETPKPADNTIWLIKKVASEGQEEAEPVAVSEKTFEVSFEEIAEMEKASMDIEYEDLIALTRESFDEIIHCASEVGIFLKPKEYQFLYLHSENLGDLAKTLHKNDVVFSDYAEKYEKNASYQKSKALAQKPIKKGVHGKVLNDYRNRYSVPGNTKNAHKGPDNKIPAPLMGTMEDTASSYAGYREGATEAASGSAGSVNSLSSSMLMNKESSVVTPALVGIGSSYFIASDAWRRSREGKPIPATEKFVAENPTIAALISGLGVHQGQKFLGKNKIVIK